MTIEEANVAVALYYKWMINVYKRIKDTSTVILVLKF